MMKQSWKNFKKSRWSKVACLLGAFLFLSTSLTLIQNSHSNGLCYAADKDSNLSYGRPSFVDLSKTVKPAVVNIRTEKVVKGKDRLSRYYFGPNVPRDFFGEDFSILFEYRIRRL